MEKLITTLTAIDPLENRLAQINEYIRSMKLQLLMEPTKYQEDFTKAYAKLEETETEFCRVMRAEEYFEQKLRAQCTQPHTRTRELEVEGTESDYN